MKPDKTYIAISGEKILEGESMSSLSVVYEYSQKLVSICYGKERYVVAGKEGPVMYSDDGKKWTECGFK